MEEKFLDEQQNNIQENLCHVQDNIQDNNKSNADENVPLKNDIIPKITKNIEKNLYEGDDNKEDDNSKDNNKEDEVEEFPIRLELEEEKEPLIIIKTKLQTHWAQNYKEKDCKWCNYIIVLFYIILPLITSLNLIGIFQIISVMNALYKVLSNSFWSFLGFEDKEDELYNFYSFYFKESINEGIDFDLIETMSFLGMIFYDFYGFKITSIIFIIPNGLSFFLLYVIFKEYNDDASKQNDLVQIFYLFVTWVLLFIGVGSSALLSQQMLMDNYGKYISFMKQVNYKDYQNNEDDQSNNFIFICGTSIIGAIIKYIVDIIISRQKNRFDEKYNITDFYDIYNNITNHNITEINNIIYSHDKFIFFVSMSCIYGLAIISSIILYLCFQCYVYKDSSESEIEIIGTEGAKRKFSKITGGLKKINGKNEEISEDEIKKICQFFGYILYFDKIENQKDKDNQEAQHHEIEFKNNKEIKTEIQIEKEQQNAQTTIIKNLPTMSEYTTDNYSRKCKCFFKTCKLLGNCLLKFCSNLKIISNSFKNCVSKIMCNFICKNICNKNKAINCPCCFWCECCYCCCVWCGDHNESCCCCCDCCRKVNNCFIKCTNPIEDKDYKQNKVYYLFCYKSERNLKWLDKFIKDEAQFKFLPLLVEFFLLQLITIVFEIKAEEHMEEGYIEFINSANTINIIIFFLELIGILFFVFIFTYFFGVFRIYLYKKSTNEKFKFKCAEVSDITLNGTLGIVIVNSLISLIGSIYCLSNELGNFFLYIPILMNKFYYFVFSNHCTVYTDSDGKIDYFSSATLLSIYLYIWELIIDNIFKNIPITILLFIQIVLSSLIIVTFIISVIILMASSKNNNCFYNYIFDKFIKIKDENIKKKIKDIIVIKCRGAINLYTSPPLIGLKKNSSKHYLNSTLQCLSQTESLTNYFLKKTVEELNGNIIRGSNDKDFPISNVYYELIQNLWSTKENASSFSSKHLMKRIEKINLNKLDLEQPGAYKEFIIFILNNIHNELKRYIKSKENNIKEPKDKYNRYNTYSHYLNDFVKSLSIISDVFTGHIEITSKCLNCQRLGLSWSPISFSYTKFNYLIFPLEEINNYNYNKDFVTLDDCFEYNQKEKPAYCEDCHYYPSTRTSKIFLAPINLILILDRGKENLSNVKLKIEKTYDITRFVLNKDKEKVIYNLYAVLTHFDQNHFVALCKSPVNNNWYKFDDETIEQIDEREVIKFDSPDILFYKR